METAQPITIKATSYFVQFAQAKGKGITRRETVLADSTQLLPPTCMPHSVFSDPSGFLSPCKRQTFALVFYLAHKSILSSSDISTTVDPNVYDIAKDLMTSNMNRKWLVTQN